MENKNNKTLEFIRKAKLKHGNKYEYDKVVYLRCNQKVIITCKIHGDFFQIPSCHLVGKGCIKCGREKRKETWLKNYGVEHPSRNKEIKEKRKQTWLKNLGVENPSQNEKIKEKKKQTCLKNHGVEHPFQNKEVQEKSKQTCKEKYNGHPSKNNEIKEKKKQTCLKNCGVENPFQSKEVQEKIKKTNSKRYGVENPMQNPEIFKKQQESSFRSKPFTFPSGLVVLVQGYEPFALKSLLSEDILFSQIFKEEDITVGATKIPTFKYTLDKERTYYPDIYLPKINTILEIKSTRTFEIPDEILENYEKWSSVINNDYNMVVAIYSSKGALLNKHIVTSLFLEEYKKKNQ